MRIPNPTGSMLECALTYAAAGMPVFPCNGRVPAIAGGRGVHDATCDAEVIRKMWSAHPEANIGFHPAPAGMLVVDYDTYDGADIDGFVEAHELPDTVSVSTVSGGTHEYYLTDEVVPPSTGRVGDRIDVRCDSSYVILPPSRIGDLTYEFEDGGGVPAKAPRSLIKACLATKKKPAEMPEHDIEADQQVNVDAFVKWLNEDATLAEVGQRNHMLAATGAMGHSHAISPYLTYALIAEHWNSRLVSPLSDGEVEQTAISGHSSANGAWGSRTVEYWNKCVDSVFSKVGASSPVKGPYRIIDRSQMNRIKPPEWLADDTFPRLAYSIIFGPPSSGKTFVALDLALSIASGLGTWLDKPVVRGRTMFIAGEGRASLVKRVRAWESHYFDGKEVEDFFLADPVPLVARGFAGFGEAAADLHETYDLIVIDTVGRALAGQNENSQEAVSALTLEIDYLRNRFGATVLALHHSGHEKGRERGSSVFRADADTVLSMDDGILSMVKQKDADVWDNPLVLRKVEVADSVVMELERDELVTSLYQEKRPPKSRDEKMKAAAMAADSMCARLLGKLPVGRRFSRNKLAEWLEGVEPTGVRAPTWRSYLSILVANETATREFYDIIKGDWVNRGRKTD